ncbi:MAG: radical SAM protein [Leptospirales bacterium]
MSTNILKICQSAENGLRITPKEALALWKEGDIYTLGKTANVIREKKATPGVVSYTVFRIINYTDICSIDCSFCSFKHKASEIGGYVLSEAEILEKVGESYKQDCLQVFFQGGVNPSIPMEYYTGILSKIHEKFPGVHIRAFSPIEVLVMAKTFHKSVDAVLDELIEAGLQSFPGAGAEILTDRMRHILSDKKASPAEWFETMKVALSKGLKGSTNIVWGSAETPEEIIEHLSMIRRLQDETGNVVSFVPWTFQQQTKDFPIRHVNNMEYLKMVALARIFFDNIPNIETSLMVKGKEAGEMALHFGANDINSPVIEEKVLRSYGLKSAAEAESFIQQSGFSPLRRNLNYEPGKKS